MILKYPPRKTMTSQTRGNYVIHLVLAGSIQLNSLKKKLMRKVRNLRKKIRSFMR